MKAITMKKTLASLTDNTTTTPLNLNNTTSPGIFSTPGEALNFGGKVALGTLIGVGVIAIAKPAAEMAVDAIQKSPMMNRAKTQVTGFCKDATTRVQDFFKKPEAPVQA
jgi:hypothetical protein